MAASDAGGGLEGVSGRPARFPAKKPAPALAKRKYKRSDLDEKLERLLDLAFLEFSSKGYAGTSLSQLVSLSGVSKSTIFRHFNNKEGLFIKLMDRQVGQMRPRLAILELDTQKPVESLMSIAKIFAETTRDPLGLGLLRLAIAEQATFPSLSSSLLSYFYETLRPVENFMKHLNAAGVIKCRDPLNVAFEFVSLVTQGIRFVLQDTRFLDVPDRDRVVAERFLKGWS